MKHFAFLSISLSLSLLMSVLNAASPTSSFATFDDRATKGGKPLNVVFFGGSLTWGANSSNPQVTSYRGLMMDYLLKKYPQTQLRFFDAAIGGTGSELGIFRYERDVLSRKPDLVFLDFTANDGFDQDDPVAISAYESLVRDMVRRGIAVEQVYFGFKFCFADNYHPEKFLGYQMRRKLAESYHTACGDTYPYIQEKITSGQAKIDVLWGINHGKDGAHPDDAGYQLFFEAARDGFEQAIREKRVATIPEKPVFSDALHQHTRQVLIDSPLPEGWKREKTYRTSMWFDGLSSRWMDDVVVADIIDKATVKPLKTTFNGTFVGLFGEAAPDGLGFKIKIDDKPLPCTPNPKTPPSEAWETHSAKNTGNLFYWRVLSQKLAPGRHTLEIEPIFPEGQTTGQLRIESVCSAGE